MAKRFRFKLEAVKRIRVQSRDAQRRAVADAVREVHLKEEAIRDYEGQLRDTVTKTAVAQEAQRLDMTLIRGHQFYRTRMQQRIVRAELDLADSQAELRGQQAKLGEATKRLRVIEKLYDKQWQRYTLQVGREEQAELDEVAAQGFVRTRVATTFEEVTQP